MSPPCADIRDYVHCKLTLCPICTQTPTTLISSLPLAPQIHRSKNKWKFNLKDGIMNLNGRDYVFSKTIGDAEWWSRKQQEQELCNSFDPVNRHFSILPYPVTGFLQEAASESLRTLQTQRVVRYCKNLGVIHRKHSTSVARTRN